MRADVALARRGLARSRSHAAQLIAVGDVVADGRAVTKASHVVSPSTTLTVSRGAGWVSRAAQKLTGALSTFGVHPAGRSALDLGASTGGFTQVLLEHDAAHVIALDVGHGQLADELRRDERVTVVEGFNVRDLSADAVGAMAAPSAPAVSLVVADLSFISLRLVLPAVREAVPDAEMVALIKPQFEVGRTRVRHGIVRDPTLHVSAIEGALRTAAECGYGVGGISPSQLVGTHGNREYLVHLGAGIPSHPSEWLPRLESIVGA